MRQHSISMMTIMTMAFACVTIAGCSKDDEENLTNQTTQEPVANPDSGSDSTTEKAVTGSVTDITKTSATILGYVNIDEALATTAKVSVELSETEDFATPIKVKTTELMEDCSFSVIVEDLEKGTIYYYRTHLKLGEDAYYGEVLNFVTKGLCPDENHPHAIDLGINVKWACCNVGASAPEGYGDYFAWGETTPKSDYNWSTYKWCEESYDTMTKYCTSGYYGTVDNKITLDPEDDAACAKWGDTWRMPSTEERDKLISECTWTWITQNGYLVTGPNGNSIILPAAGHRSEETQNPVDPTAPYGAASSGDYWTNTLYEGSNHLACCLSISSSYNSKNSIIRRYRYKNFFNGRYCGYSVRPVVAITE